MNSRTAQSVVSFRSAFALPDFDVLQPPGEYLVHRDEELIEGVSHHLAWRRVATFIYLPAVSTKA